MTVVILLCICVFSLGLIVGALAVRLPAPAVSTNLVNDHQLRMQDQLDELDEQVAVFARRLSSVSRTVNVFHHKAAPGAGLHAIINEPKPPKGQA